MNILFVYSMDDVFSPAKPLRTQEEMQFGISYISSYLKNHGHRTSLIVLSRILGRKNKTVIDSNISKLNPKLICFTAVTSEFRFICSMARYIKDRCPNIYLIIGGPHVSLNPEDVPVNIFDAICIGEGEYPVLELTEQLENKMRPSAIPNLWIKNGSTFEKNEPRPFLQDIDALPFPDREMWQGWIDKSGGSRYPILLGRGCPFQCTYCCNHALRRVAKDSYVRLRSPDKIAEEISQIAGRSPDNREFYLEVETIGASRGWAMGLCSKLQGLNQSFGSTLSFGTNLRITPNAKLEGLFAAFKRSNVRFIRIGVESGSERVRREILNRDYSNQDIIDTVMLARKYDIEINFYNLIGVPGETAADFKETIEINRRCLPDRVFAHIFFPYPGTELYSVCLKQGLIDKNMDVELERCKATLDLPCFPRKEIQKGFVWFDYNVYKGHKPIRQLISKVVVSKLRSNSYLHYFYRTITYSAIFRWFRALANKRL